MSNDKQSLTDEALMRLCADGRNEALEEIVRRYQAPLYRFLMRLLGSPEDAEEAVLTVFVRAWQSAARFQYRSRVVTWLYRIAANVATDLKRKQKARPELPWPESFDGQSLTIESTEADVLRRLEQHNQSQALQAALNLLGEMDRLLLVLYYYEELEYPEIQAITSLSYPVLKTRLTRARRRLRTLLERADAEEVV